MTRKNKITAALATAAVALTAFAGAAEASTSSTISIMGTNGDYYGYVHSSDATHCENNRKVVVYKQLGSAQSPKTDQKIGTDIAEPNGPDAMWSIGNSGFNVFGSVSGALLYGKFKDKHSILATGNTTIDILDNDHRLFADNRRTQIDMRFAKIFRFSSRRANAGVDLGNLLNTNYATTYEDTYQYSVGNTGQGGTWNNPTAIYTPRFVRWNLTVNF